MEPIIEIFIDEGFALVSGIEEKIEDRMREGRYQSKDLEEIKRHVHTMKVNSTMVLFDALAEVSKSVERLLTYSAGCEAWEDNEFLDEILKRTIHFYQAEVEKVAAGREPDGEDSLLCEDVKQYLEAHKMGTDMWQEEKAIQRYYIPGLVKDGEEL